MTTNENDKTSIYGGSDNDKTNVYGDSNSNNTEAYGNTTQSTDIYSNNQHETSSYSEQANPEFRSKTHGIGVGDTIILKNITYSIVGIISEGTGEAVIYKIEDSNKKVLVLKLYFEFSNVKEEPNHETLKRIKEITDPDILKLHDFGVGADKYQGKFCFEISDFAEGGDLFSVSDFKGKYTPEFIEHHVVKEVFLGIKRLHDHKIFHCDLKPQNVFYLDANQSDLVIGDYGSAKAYDLDSLKDIRKSSTVKGTDAFLPPEQARGIISEKNDYYSFGMILLHLLYPEEFASNSNSNIRVIDKNKYEKIIERQYNSQPIIEYNPSYKRLNNLIEGLTLVNHINRFGKEELERWLNGEELEVKYKAVETSTIQPVKLGYATITTAKDFIHVIETQPTWYSDIIEDPDSYSTVKAWLDSYRDVPTRKVFDSMVRYYQPFGVNYVQEAILRYFDPQRPIVIDMHSFNFISTENLSELVESFVAKIDDIWKITKIENIAFYLFQLEFTLRQLATISKDEHTLLVNSLVDKIYSVFNMIPKSFEDYKTEIQSVLKASNDSISHKQLLELFYTFNEKRTFKDQKNNQYYDIEDIGYLFAIDQTLFEDEYNQVELKVFLEKKEMLELFNSSFITFLCNIFNSEIRSSIIVQNIQFTHREAYISYSINKSLLDFFANKGIDSSVIEKGENLSIELTTSIKPKSSQLNNEFLTTIYRKHEITENNCEASSLKTLKSKIKSITSAYRKSCSKKAATFTWGILSYSIPAIIGLISAIIVIYPPDIIRSEMASSDLALSTLVIM